MRHTNIISANNGHLRPQRRTGQIQRASITVYHVYVTNIVLYAFLAFKIALDEQLLELLTRTLLM